jgi:hypothetical protein
VSSPDSLPKVVETGSPNRFPPVSSNHDSPSSVPGAIADETDWLHSVQKPSGLAKILFGLALLVSLGLHGVLLLLPTGSENKATTQKPEEKSIRITQLPMQIKAPVVKQLPKAPALRKPTVVTKPLRSNTTVPALRQPKPQAAPPPSPRTASANTTASGANPWQDFPQYPGAETGCHNLQSCLQTADGLDKVTAFFEKELDAKKYASKLTITEANRKVYQVARNGITQFLSVIEEAGKGTIYVLAEAPRSLSELAKAVEVPAEIYSVLQNLDAGDAIRSNFTQPDLFYSGDSPRSDIGIMKLVPNANASTFFDEYFNTNLRNNEFDFSETGQTYGNGPIYAIKKGKLSLYLNMVPTQDGTGTIVVVWKQLPK